jgi:hypothetical protein
MSRSLRVLVLVGLVTMLAVPGAALAGPGVMYFIEGEETLEGYCDFDIELYEVGHARIWEQPAGKDMVFRGVFSFAMTLENAETGKTVHFRDAGTDIARLRPDGHTELAIIGRSFWWGTVGRLVVVFDEDENIVDWHHSGRVVSDEVCDALAS